MTEVYRFLGAPQRALVSCPVLVVPSTTLLIGNLEMERVLISSTPPRIPPFLLKPTP